MTEHSYNGVSGVKFISKNVNKSLILLEHRMGFEPMNTGFADQRVSHFAIGALVRRTHYTCLSRR